MEKNGHITIKYVIPRPGLLSFMEKMSEIFNICIYTCGEETVIIEGFFWSLFHSM